MKNKSVFLIIILSMLFVLSSITVSWADSSQCLVVRKSDDSLWVARVSNGSAGSFFSITGRFVSQPTVVWDQDTQRYYLYGTGLLGAVFRRALDENCNTVSSWEKMTGDGFSDSPIGASGGGRYLNFNMTQSSSHVQLDTYVKNIIWQSIRVPDDGFVVATATGFFNNIHNAGVSNEQTIWLTTSNAGTNDYGIPYVLPSNAPSGVYLKTPFAMQHYFSVANNSGNVQFILTAKTSTTTGATVWIDTPSLKLEYYPYRY